MNDKTLTNYKKYIKKKILTILILLVIVFILMILCLSVGSSNMGFIETLKAFFNIGDEANSIIIWRIRIPRTLAAIIAGSGLALAGCIMQSILKNPMASPTTLGVSNGAVFGANFAIIVLGAGAVSTSTNLSVTINNPYVTTICAFVFAMISAITILILSKRRKFASETIVLAGVALGSLFTAGTTIMQYFADDTKLSSAIFWTFGDLGNATYLKDLIMFVIVFVSFIYFFISRWNYNALSSGDETATSLGVKVSRTRFIGLLLSSLICAVCVSFLGIIGFIGLLAPHIIKRIVGSDHRFLLIASMLTGSAILLLADFISRCFMQGISLPIGAITSLFGAPLFLWLLLKRKRGGSQ